MPSRDDIILKVRLQASGARLGAGPAPRLGGAGPTDGVTVFFGGLVATVPTEAPFVAGSPFELVEEEAGRGVLLREGRVHREVEFARPPGFYTRRTDEGVEYRKIALRHGRDAIGSTVAQTCMRTGDDACAFCGISLSREAGSTVGLKRPEDIGRVGRAAMDEGYGHTVLTTGTTDPHDCGIAHLESCSAALKESTGGAMKVHVQFEPPLDEEWIDRVGAISDSAAINMECFDERTLARVAPGKAATGMARYVRSWEKAVSVFGQGQVCCFILAGLGEEPGSIVRGAEFLCDIGVYPYVLPLRPVRGTPLGRRRPPSAEFMIDLYERVAIVIEKAAMSPGGCRAGCVRCGACSALTDW